MSGFENHIKRKIYVLAAVSDSEELRRVKAKNTGMSKAFQKVLDATKYVYCHKCHGVGSDRNYWVYKCDKCGECGCSDDCGLSITGICHDCNHVCHLSCLDEEECPMCGGCLE